MYDRHFTLTLFIDNIFYLEGTAFCMSDEYTDIKYTDTVDMVSRRYDAYTPTYLIPGSFRTYNLRNLNESSASYAHIVGKNVSWILPVPNLLNYDSDYNWSEEELGHQGQLAGDLISAFTGGEGGGGFWNMVGKAFNTGKEMVRSGVSKLTSESTTKHVLRKKDGGEAYNPNKQLYFNEVTMRDFEVYFYLSPMSMKEAENIRKSFQQLVYWAAPEYKSDKFFFSYPDFFNFAVTLNGTTMYERRNLAITRVSLDFTSDGNMTWHEDGFPTALQLTVGFKESQIPTRENLKKITLFGINLGSGARV